jgi:addiction module RelE/StbE family toxin
MTQVVWSLSALEDLEEIVKYIAADNPQAALNIIERIESTAGALGHRAIGRPGRVSGTYEKVVTGLPHIIAYAIERLRGGAERIVILRVIHGARNWPNENWPKS